MKAPRRWCTVVLAAGCVATCLLQVRTARAVDDSGARDPRSSVRVRLEAARADAGHVDQQLSDARARRVQLEAAIADAERAIPALRARVEELEAAVKERAVELYMGHRNRLETAFDAVNALTGARATQLAGIIAEHSTELAGALRDAASKLEVRASELTRERDALHRTIDTLVALEAQLQDRLRAASAAYERVEQALDLVGRTDAAVGAPSGAARCPVDGFVVFSDNFHEARPGGVFHQGIDMNAVSGTPVIAPVGGVLRHDVGGAGGNGAWLAGTDDVSYYFAHFSRYEGDDRIVVAGEVIGYVGMTGDATGPHLHFEMHPAGGDAVDPYALLVALCASETGRDVG